MLIFNCSKAAADFFTVTRQKKKQSPLVAAPTETTDERGTPQAPTSQWLVHAIKINRKHVLVVMHVHTRYAMVFSGIKKGDWIEFLNRMVERLFNNMQFFGEEFALCDDESFNNMLARFIAFHGKPCFCQRGDRSVQSHINDVAWHFENRVYEEGCLPNNQQQAASFDAWMNNYLRKTKQQSDYFYPDEEMFIDWISTYGDLHPSEQERLHSYFTSLRRKSLSDITEPERLKASQAEMDAEVDELMRSEASRELPDNVIDFQSAKANKK